MQQQWVAFWESVTETATRALWPFQAIAGYFGFSPGPAQIWAFLCGLFICLLVVPSSYGDLILRSRRALATGRVVKIDTSSDAPYTPTIEFRDASGHTWTFDSNLPINGATKTIGAEVAIMYDPANPKRAREVGRPFQKAINNVIWYAIIVVLFGSAFLVK